MAAEAVDGHPKRGFLSKIANEVFSLEGMAKILIWGIGINFFVFGVGDFTLLHNNIGGKAFVESVNAFCQLFYDNFGITTLLSNAAAWIGGPEIVDSVKNTFIGNTATTPVTQQSGLDLLSS